MNRFQMIVAILLHKVWGWLNDNYQFTSIEGDGVMIQLEAFAEKFAGRHEIIKRDSKKYPFEVAASFLGQRFYALSTPRELIEFGLGLEAEK